MAKKPLQSRPKGPRRLPVQDRSKRTWEAILAAAARLLVRQGYAGTTTNHVARKAGVSIGTLYEYFPDKQALVVALLEQHLSEARQLLEGETRDLLANPFSLPLTTIVERVVTAIIRLHEHDPRLHRVLFDLAQSIPHVRKRAEQLEDEFTELVATVLEHHPEARVSDPELAARLVVRTVEQLVHGWIALRNAQPAPAARYRAELVKLVSSYLVR